MRHLSVKVRLFLMSVVALLATLIVGLVGISGLKTSDKAASNMYENAMIPATEIGTLNGSVGKMVADLLLAFQHDPAGATARMHDHPIGVHFESAEAWKKLFEKHWAKAKSGLRTDAELKLVKSVDDGYKGFIGEVYEPVKARLNGGDYSPDTLTLLVAGFQKYAEPVEKTLSETIRLQETIGSQLNDATTAAYENSRNIMIAVIIISIAVMLTFAILITTSIADPLSRISSTMDSIVHTGNFTNRVEVKSRDEVSKMAISFNELIDSLQETFKMMLSYVSQFDRASEELAQLSDKVAKASVKTSDSSSDMAASVEEMTASIVQVGENAKETDKNAEEVMTLSEDGSEIVNKTISEMQKMSQAVENSSETIGELGRQSEQISGIVQTIKDVADQTNLLALNAAIEAARAGEQGRGFAVVADEIRKLAERTTRATTEIAAMISAIQESSHTAVTSMTHAANMVSEGVSLAEQAGESIDKIKQGAQQAKTRVSSITAALNEQSSASHQIASQVERVAQATDENSEAATSSSKAAEHIAKLARSMREAMARFKV